MRRCGQQEMGDVYAQLEQLTKEALKLSESGHTSEALGKFQDALRLSKECQSESDAFGTCLFNAGVCMTTLENYDEALSTLKSAVALWPNVLECKDEEKIRMFADAHLHMATCCYALNRAGEAMPQLRQSLLGYESLQPNSKKDIAMVCWQLTCRLEEQCRYSEALDFVQRVVECATDLEDHCLLARAYREKTLILSKNKERPIDVSEFLELAQASCDAIEDVFVQSEVFSSIGDAYVSLKMSEKAEACFSKALDALRTNTNEKSSSYHSKEASLLQNVGAARNLMEKYEESIQFHKEAMDLHASLGQRQNQIHCMLNLGYAHTMLKQYNEAANVLANAAEVAGKCRDKELEISVLENLATAQYCDGMFEEAVDSFQKALCALGCVSRLSNGAQANEVSQRIVGKLSDAISMREEKRTKNIVKQNTTFSSSHSNQVNFENSKVDIAESHTPIVTTSQERKSSSLGSTSSDDEGGNSNNEESSSSSSVDVSESEQEPLPSKQLQPSLSSTLSGGPTVGTKIKLEQRLKQLESSLESPHTPTTLLSHSTPKLKTERLEGQFDVRRKQQQHVVQEGCLATGENIRRVRAGAGQNQTATLETVKEDNGSISTNTTVESKTSSVCVFL